MYGSINGSLSFSLKYFCYSGNAFFIIYEIVFYSHCYCSILLQLLCPASALSRLDKIPTAGGFPTAFKGWTSFPLQAYNRRGLGYGEEWPTEGNLRLQASALAQQLLGSGYKYFMIDSGWSHGF